jgi:choice-of-anchor A domain-containing protein
MRKVFPVLALTVFFCAAALCRADSAPLGVASAFNLVALGTVDSSGNIVLAGNMGTSADVEGRLAAANLVTVATTIGSTLGSDPYGSLAENDAMVAGGGVSASNYFQINGGGNVYAPTNNASYNWNENPKGALISTGSSPINFTGLRTALDAETLELAALTPNGVVGAPTPKGGNPSWLVLDGTSKTLNVFTVTAAQFADGNHPLDIEVPAGSTVVINVEGAHVTLGTGIYVNGQQEGDGNNDDADILFNFADASAVSIDGQLDGAVLAPFAIFTSDSQVGGTIIAAQIGQTGEVHNLEFEGALPAQDEAPEPGTLSLMGIGLLFIGGLFLRRRSA